jgi:hypothetical protein
VKQIRHPRRIAGLPCQLCGIAAACLIDEQAVFLSDESLEATRADAQLCGASKHCVLARPGTAGGVLKRRVRE